MSYQPKTGAACSCRPGLQRDNCPSCEGTGQRIDFAAIRSRAMTAKHTPGPWEAVCTEGRELDATQLVKDSRHQIVALCDEDIQKPRTEREANARLIAAAPEMAEALRAIYDYDELHEEAGNQETRLGELARSAEAALQKAGLL